MRQWAHPLWYYAVCVWWSDIIWVRLGLDWYWWSVHHSIALAKNTSPTCIHIRINPHSLLSFDLLSLFQITKKEGVCCYISFIKASFPDCASLCAKSCSKRLQFQILQHPLKTLTIWCHEAWDKLWQSLLLVILKLVSYPLLALSSLDEFYEKKYVLKFER